MRLRRWKTIITYALPDGTEQSIEAGPFFTRWGANEFLTWKLGSLPIVMLWAHGDIEWIRGDVERV